MDEEEEGDRHDIPCGVGYSYAKKRNRGVNGPEQECEVCCVAAAGKPHAAHLFCEYAVSNVNQPL